MCAEYNGPPLRKSRLLNEKIVRKMLSIHFKDRRVSFLLKQLEGGSPEMDYLVDQVTDRVVRLTERFSKGENKMPTLEEFIQENWAIHSGNLNSEFSNVVSEMFIESVNWGKITALLQFAGVYCSYAIHEGLPETIIESVCAWTVLVLENDLYQWFKEHYSWEEYVSYADKRLSLPQSVNGIVRDDGGWTTTAGALSIGVAVAFIVKNAFS